MSFQRNTIGFHHFVNQHNKKNMTKTEKTELQEVIKRPITALNIKRPKDGFCTCQGIKILSHKEHHKRVNTQKERSERKMETSEDNLKTRRMDSEKSYR